VIVAFMEDPVTWSNVVLTSYGRSTSMTDLIVIGYLSLAGIVIGINAINQIKEWMGK
jgi:hypothetical protein